MGVDSAWWTVTVRVTETGREWRPPRRPPPVRHPGPTRSQTRNSQLIAAAYTADRFVACTRRLPKATWASKFSREAVVVAISSFAFTLFQKTGSRSRSTVIFRRCVWCFSYESVGPDWMLEITYLHPLRMLVLLLCVCRSVCLSVVWITQKIVNEFWWFFSEGCDMHIATTNGILVMIQIAMQIQKFFMKFLPLRDKKKQF